MIDLDELARAATKLAPLPTTSTRLAALVCEGTPELGQVVEIVQFDEALTASLLQSANSSWSASRSEITTVRDAVIRLGASPVLALTLGMTVRRQLLDSLPQYGLGEGELWRHSVGASLAAELLTQRAPRRPPAETATPADGDTLVAAVYLADALAKGVGAGIDDNPDPDAFASAMVELGLGAVEFDEIRALVEQRLSEVESRFE